MERGLKCTGKYNREGSASRSREGAWIEILYIYKRRYFPLSRSREGAWIEINQRAISDKYINVAPVRERGLKFATQHRLQSR